jgi:hypothetical protein
MSCELFAKTKFQARTIATIEQANAVLTPRKASL